MSGQLQPPPSGPIGPTQGVMQIGAPATSPIPPPEQLAQYEQVVPGSADRLIRMAEEQSAARIYLMKAQGRQSDRTQWLAFILAIWFLAGSVWITLGGFPIVGGILGGLTIGGIVAVFITGKALQKRASEQKIIENAPQTP